MVYFIASGKCRHQHLQLILPQELVPTVLDALHNHPTAGHLGVTKTLQKVRSRFYWPGQRRDVEDWCRACNSCASRNMLPKSRHAPLQLHQPGVPLQRVAMDILGPLPETERGNRYILVITDYFTTFVVSELLIIYTRTRAAILNPTCLVKFVNCLECQKPGLPPTTPSPMG